MTHARKAAAFFAAALFCAIAVKLGLSLRGDRLAAACSVVLAFADGSAASACVWETMFALAARNRRSS
jgi:hypothetical protein